MKPADFDYALPPELIAQAPLPVRSASRLLVADAAAGTLDDRAFIDLPALLDAGDLLVFNDTRVIPARLYGKKDSGGLVEILLERTVGEREAWVQMRASKAPKAGGRIALADGTGIEVVGRVETFWHVRFDGHEPLESLLIRLGHMPLPPYINRPDSAADRERYQTVYAAKPGAVAAPTAGLHFDDAVFAALDARGIGRATLTLHVGAGTFQPLRVDDITEHRMHREWLCVDAALVDAISATRARGKRVVAVGTTVVRALETAAAGGKLAPYAGDTQIFIYPGHRFRAIDALVTNFHLPQSTLMMLVSALAGRDFILGAYRHAVDARYRFFSYGDAMLLLPRAASGTADAL